MSLTLPGPEELFQQGDGNTVFSHPGFHDGAETDWEGPGEALL